jgi:hypothetical protein
VVASTRNKSDGSDPGDNYSWDVNFDDQSVRIHDGECDGDGGYTVYTTTSDMGTERRMDDPDGCSSAEGTASSLTYLYKHKTREDHQFSPDPCWDFNVE